MSRLASLPQQVKLRLNESGVLTATEAELLEERVVDAPPEPAAAKPAASPTAAAAGAAGAADGDKKPADGAAPMDTSNDDASKVRFKLFRDSSLGRVDCLRSHSCGFLFCRLRQLRLPPRRPRLLRLLRLRLRRR